MCMGLVALVVVQFPGKSKEELSHRGSSYLTLVSSLEIHRLGEFPGGLVVKTNSPQASLEYSGVSLRFMAMYIAPIFLFISLVFSLNPLISLPLIHI